jgi:hypothetical protein
MDMWNTTTDRLKRVKGASTNTLHNLKGGAAQTINAVKEQIVNSSPMVGDHAMRSKCDHQLPAHRSPRARLPISRNPSLPPAAAAPPRLTARTAAPHRLAELRKSAGGIDEHWNLRAHELNQRLQKFEQALSENETLQWVRIPRRNRLLEGPRARRGRHCWRGCDPHAP